MWVLMHNSAVGYRFLGDLLHRNVINKNFSPTQCGHRKSYKQPAEDKYQMKQGKWTNRL